MTSSSEMSPALRMRNSVEHTLLARVPPWRIGGRPECLPCRRWQAVCCARYCRYVRCVRYDRYSGRAGAADAPAACCMAACRLAVWRMAA
jgi:hypothetical protein